MCYIYVVVRLKQNGIEHFENTQHLKNNTDELFFNTLFFIVITKLWR